MTTLAFEGGAPRHLLARLLDRPDLAQVVQSLDPKVLHQLVRHFGLEECGEVIALATTQQLTQIFDDDLWSSDTPGAEDRFDADRFGLWLEVLAEAGDAVAAQKLVEMDFDFVTAALSRQFLVLNSETLMMLRGETETDFGDYDPMRVALTELALEDRESCEIGGYTVIATRSESWDALLSLLTSLERAHGAFFGSLMKRCSQISTEYLADNGGLYEVLTADQQIMADIAGAREERRERQGHVTPSQAAAFLKLARTRQEGDAPWDLDPVTAAYFRDLRRREQPREDLPAEAPQGQVSAFVASIEAGIRNEPHGLLPAGPPGAGDRLSRIRAQMSFTQSHDSSAHAQRTVELAYLANVLVAGCSFQSRRFRAVEAADAVLAICNLGLENCEPPMLPPDFLVRQNLAPVFRIGWRILYEDVCLFVAKSLVAALSELSCDDRDIQNQITELFRRMKTQVAAGTPWRERENLEVIAILDQPSWAMLVNLLDECAVVPKNACTPAEKPPLRVATEFEFVSENRQILWARNFAESLAERLH